MHVELVTIGVNYKKVEIIVKSNIRAKIGCNVKILIYGDIYSNAICDCCTFQIPQTHIFCAIVAGHMNFPETLETRRGGSDDDRPSPGRS